MLNRLIDKVLKSYIRYLKLNKKRRWDRFTSLGDLITDRTENAIMYGFGEGSSCYDNVLVIGDVKVGRNTWIGPNVILDGSGGLEIGSFVSISAGTQIYSHSTLDRTLSLGKEEIKYERTVIGESVYIGPNTVIEKGSKIGDNVVIGAFSLVRGSIESNCKVFGIPARIVKPL
jgi:acetyltransferase-like isoleucine patch superfamily enzyme